MNTEIKFFSKVTRNGFILAGLYFLSVWASVQQIVFESHLKPIIIFFVSYILIEAAKRYKIDYKDPKLKENICTIIL